MTIQPASLPQPWDTTDDILSECVDPDTLYSGAWVVWYPYQNIKNEPRIAKLTELRPSSLHHASNQQVWKCVYVTPETEGSLIPNNEEPGTLRVDHIAAVIPQPIGVSE